MEQHAKESLLTADKKPYECNDSTGEIKEKNPNLLSDGFPSSQQQMVWRMTFADNLTGRFTLQLQTIVF